MNRNQLILVWSEDTSTKWLEGHVSLGEAFEELFGRAYHDSDGIEVSENLKQFDDIYVLVDPDATEIYVKKGSTWVEIWDGDDKKPTGKTNRPCEDTILQLKYELVGYKRSREGILGIFETSEVPRNCELPEQLTVLMKGNDLPLGSLMSLDFKIHRKP